VVLPRQKVLNRFCSNAEFDKMHRLIHRVVPIIHNIW